MPYRALNAPTKGAPRARGRNRTRRRNAFTPNGRHMPATAKDPQDPNIGGSGRHIGVHWGTLGAHYGALISYLECDPKAALMRHHMANK